MLNGTASMNGVAQAASVSYQDSEIGERREVRAYPQGGSQTLLYFTDAEGTPVWALLTPELSTAIRAALALADLPGAEVRGCRG